MPREVLEECLEIFRSNLFSISGRKQVPTLIFNVLDKQLQHEYSESQVSETDLTIKRFISLSGQENLYEVSKKVYESMQVVLEFMDKGIKGLLTGDMSYDLVKQI
jgi:hypothetical protein